MDGWRILYFTHKECTGAGLLTNRAMRVLHWQLPCHTPQSEQGKNPGPTHPAPQLGARSGQTQPWENIWSSYTETTPRALGCGPGRKAVVIVSAYSSSARNKHTRSPFLTLFPAKQTACPCHATVWHWIQGRQILEEDCHRGGPDLLQQDNNVNSHSHNAPTQPQPQPREYTDPTLQGQSTDLL